MGIIGSLKTRWLIVILMLFTSSVNSNEIHFIESAKTYNSPLRNLTLYDTDGDSAYEILASNDSGEVILFESSALAEIWSKKFFSSPAGAAVVGYISNEPYPLGCVADEVGNISVFYLGNGDIYCQAKLSAPVNTSFSLLKDPSSNQLLPVFADSAGNVKILKIHDKKIDELKNFPPETDKNPRIGITDFPVTISDVNGDGKEEIISATSQGYVQIIFPFAENASRLFYRLPDSSPFTTLVGSDSLISGGEISLIAGSNNTFRIFKTDGTQIVEKSFLKGLGKVHSQINFADLNQDGRPEVIGTSENCITTYYEASSDSNSPLYLDASPRPLTTLAPSFTGASLFDTTDGKTRIFTSDKDKYAWIWDGVTDSEETPKFLLPVAIDNSFVPCGNISGKNRLEFLFFNSKSKKLMTGTISGFDTTPQLAYITPGGNFQRHGRWNDTTKEQLKNEISKVSSELSRIKNAPENGGLMEKLFPQAKNLGESGKKSDMLTILVLVFISSIVLVFIGLKYKKSSSKTPKT